MNNLKKQKGFLLNPFRFAVAEPYVLGTTNILVGLPTSSMTILSPFAEHTTGSLSKINDGNPLSSDSSTIAIRGSGFSGGDSPGAPIFNNNGGIEFTFSTPKRVGRIRTSFSPTTFFFVLNCEYWDATSSSWVLVSSELNYTYPEYSYIVSNVNYTSYPNAISTKWRVRVTYSGSVLANEVRFGEIEMYEWIEV